MAEDESNIYRQKKLKKKQILHRVKEIRKILDVIENRKRNRLVVV